MVMLLGIGVLDPVTFTLRFLSDSQLNRVNRYCSPQPPSILNPPPTCLSDDNVTGTIAESTDELVADWAPVEDRRATAHATSLGVRGTGDGKAPQCAAVAAALSVALGRR
ncbi:hypothetical protein MUK42_25187 [Musa troglodytarum]|uniref:Uncharacterized protein n=1 Tax=Musa troglodytarum TaxID=320322 RepID=A0A9E7IHL5_9LILI|nr:hypothetical protein MUK42_25187 [Musa troglodytarum]